MNSPRRQAQPLDEEVLLLLVDSQPRLWSHGELEHATGVHAREVQDVVNRLHAAGLVHRLEGFAWAALAAGRSRRRGTRYVGSSQRQR